MINRLKQKEMEDLAAKEAFSYPTRGMEAPARLETYGRNHQDSILDRTPRDMNVKRNDRDRAEWSQRKDDGDLRNKISNRRDTLAKNVWNRLDKRYEEGNNPRDRERYHPYRQYPRENLREIRGGLESFNNRVAEQTNEAASSSVVRVVDITAQTENSVLRHFPGVEEFYDVSGLAQRLRRPTQLLQSFYSNAGYIVTESDPPWTDLY
ncbi:hypothetical protein F2Q69_00020541 [Brassica cretica]|uniref:Uncharacterized protein n=1 Tax=Brassica cretica TaxID=69181 RepID=A0A8S9PVV9_BRACR|nr:hypothetical protein F2Q69_00020541 [Brassica cretica]